MSAIPLFELERHGIVRYDFAQHNTSHRYDRGPIREISFILSSDFNGASEGNLEISSFEMTMWDNVHNCDRMIIICPKERNDCSRKANS